MGILGVLGGDRLYRVSRDRRAVQRMKTVEYGYIPSPDELAVARARWNASLTWWNDSGTGRHLADLDRQRHERYGRGNPPSTTKEVKRS